MSSSSEYLARGRVLRGAQVGAAVADLGTVSSRAARAIVVDPAIVEAAARDGYTGGFEEGYEAGYAEGLGRAEHHTEMLRVLVGRLGQAAETFGARETLAREDVEDQVVATAFRIAEAIIGRTLEDPGERARTAIARALRLAPETGIAVARLNPADAAAIGDPATLATGRALELVADPGIAPGDCIVDAAECRVDARIDAALDRVREVLA